VAVALLLLLRAVLPAAVGWFAEDALRSSLGLDVEIADVDLHLLRGRIALDGLTIAPAATVAVENAKGKPASPDAPSSTLTGKRVAVAIRLRDLLRGRLHFTDIEIVAPQIRVARRADGGFDPLFTIETPDPSAEDDEDAAALPLSIDRATIRGAAIRVVDGADESELLSLELGDVELSRLDLEGGAFTLGGIAVRGPHLLVERDFAVQPLGEGAPMEPPPDPGAASDSAPADSVQPEEPAEPATRRIESLEIDEAELTLITGERELDVRVSLRAEGTSWDPGESFPVELSLEVEDGRLTLAGDVSVAPLRFDGKMDWKDMPLPVLSIGLRPDLANWIRACRSAGSVSVVVETQRRENRPPELRIAGTAEVTGLDLQDPKDEDLEVAFEKLTLTLDELVVPMGDASDVVQIRLSDVVLDQPNIVYRHPSDALERLLSGPRPEGAPAPDAAAEPEVAGGPEDGEEPEAADEPDASVVAQAPSSASPTPRIRLSDVTVQNGTLRFEDRSVTPVYEGMAREIEASLRGVDFDDGVAIESIDAALRLRGNARARVTGGLQPSASRFEIDLERVALPPINGYASAAGIRVTQGALSSESKLQHEGNRWDLDSDLTIHAFGLDHQGSAGLREAIGMPIDVMLALLRNPSGDISLPFDVSFEEGRARTAISSSVVGAFRQAIVGAASIPLKGAASLLRLGTGGMRVADLPFAPGLADPAPEAREQIHGLAGLLEARPQLGLSLTGSAGDDDHDVLAVEVLAERLAADGDLPDLEDEDPGLFQRRRVESALRDRARGEAVALDEDDEDLLQRYLEATDVPVERFVDLANRRAQRVRDDLVTVEGIPSERVRASDDRRDDDPAVEIDLFAVE